MKETTTFYHIYFISWFLSPYQVDTVCRNKYSLHFFIACVLVEVGKKRIWESKQREQEMEMGKNDELDQRETSVYVNLLKISSVSQQS
jgi:hypothetical protein